MESSLIFQSKPASYQVAHSFTQLETQKRRILSLYLTSKAADCAGAQQTAHT